MRRLLPILPLLVAVPAASQVSFGYELERRSIETLTLAIDGDDDDEDGMADAEAERPPRDDAVTVTLTGRGNAVLRTEGDVRLLSSSRVRLPATATLQATGPEGALVTRVGRAEHRLPVRGLRLTFEGPAGPLDPLRDALAPTQHVPNDRSLPRDAGPCDDPRCVRIVVTPAPADDTVVWLERRDPTGRFLTHVPMPLSAEGIGPWMRLVVDAQDAASPGVGGRLLEVGLRDVVQARLGHATQSLRVGRPGSESGPLAARRGRLRVRIVRHGGVPSVGNDEEGAIAFGRTQIAIANQIWLQCLVDFGPPREADVAVVDTPPPWLLSVSDGDGFPAAGGDIRFRVGDAPISVTIAAGSAPVSTALRIAAALRAAGHGAEVRANPRTESGAGRSADVLVRDAEGNPATLSADGEHALSTDPRQRIRIGRVDFGDGLRSFSNDNAAAGSLEERTLLHHIVDDDPSTIDMVIINEFTGGGRQGEAFIESDRGAFPNVVFLDRSGIRQQRAAWTQSHELGHVLLDMPFHPDDLGPDRPWLLMDADSSSPVVTGPKRISPAECARARHRSGVGTVPILLDRHPR